MRERKGNIGLPALGEPLFRALVEKSSDAVALLDRHGSVLWASPAYARILGEPPESLLARDPFDRVHPDDASIAKVLWQRVVKRPGESLLSQVRLGHANGSWRWIEVIGTNLLGEPGVQAVVANFRDITGQKEAEEKLRLSEEQLRTLVEQASDGIFVTDAFGIILEVNSRGRKMLGYEREELIGKRLRSLVARPGERISFLQSRRLLRGERVVAEREIRRKDGTSITVEVSSGRLPDGRFQGFVRDITERKKGVEALRHSEAKFRHIYESSPVMMHSIDEEGRICDVNLKWLEETGYAREEVIGRRADFLMTPESATRALTVVIPQFWRDGKARDVAYQYVRKDGSSIDVVLNCDVTSDPSGRKVSLSVVQDVTARRRAEEAAAAERQRAQAALAQLSHQATHDALTGLINRREFEARLHETLEKAQTLGRSNALCYLDLDQFKIVNDTCGHVAGDELLRQLARLLMSRVREVDTLARLGGDEFGIILNGCTLDQAEELSRRLLQAIREFRFIWQEKTFEVGATIGLVPVNERSGSLHDVLSAADSACYVAKEAGRNRMHVYRPGDRLLARHHGEMQWAHRIQRALAEDRFVLHRQAIRRLAGPEDDAERYELLVRMVDEDGRVVPPIDFIPAAERYRLMPMVDRWVVKEAFAAIRRAPAGTYPVYAVNLSGQSIGDEGMLAFIFESLRDVSPHQISFEITETAAVQNLDAAQRFMSALRSQGCGFALDDFGAGLSSFAYLKELPVDALKIDGRFVSEMARNPVDRAIVEAVHKIGHTMGLVTIAEFVEDRETADALVEVGVDFGQGFGIHLPEAFE